MLLPGYFKYLPGSSWFRNKEKINRFYISIYRWRKFFKNSFSKSNVYLHTWLRNKEKVKLTHLLNMFHFNLYCCTLIKCSSHLKEKNEANQWHVLSSLIYRVNMVGDARLLLILNIDIKYRRCSFLVKKINEKFFYRNSMRFSEH